ncbi:hypothetical protein BYT27DRAFT_7297117 [Phlegmacium glaucopus]|nr:hypothetical protein BYT27DRAFT_7297117 [Phlegmacium glaucopus]
MPRQPKKTTYTKTLSALRKTELIRLADDLGLDSEGSVAELRTRLKDHLNENRDDLFRNPRYNGLYPRHRRHNQPPPPLPQPGSDTLSTHSNQFLNGSVQFRTICKQFNVTIPTIPPLTPSRKRPIRTPGSIGTNAAFLVPDHIRKRFIDGWNVHVPLTYLTDKGCMVKNKSLSNLHDLLTVNDTDSHITTSSKSLSDEGELDLTFDEWHQAWRRLLDLIKSFLPDEYAMWQTHFLYILDNHNRAELWPVFLAYNVEIRRRATQLDIDPSQFSIGIWNDLEARHTAKKVLAWVQSDMRQAPNQAGPSHHNYQSRYQLTNAYHRDDSFTRNNSRNYAFRNQTQRFNNPEVRRDREGKCIFCGDKSKSHSSRNCNAWKLVNGAPCHLLKQGPSGSRQDRSGKSYCFSWNGYSGCDQGPTCRRGEHWCSLCGSKSHNAQHCEIV